MQRFSTFTISLVALFLVFSFLIAWVFLSSQNVTWVVCWRLFSGSAATNGEDIGRDVARLYEKSITRNEIRQIIHKHYTEDARFQDPFFDVTGIDKVLTQFVAMYEAFDDYTIDYSIHDHPETNTVDIVSDANYVISGKPFNLSQKTRLTLNADNKVEFHHDIFQGSFVERLENTPILHEAFTGWRKLAGLVADPILKAKFDVEE